ncbi:MAG: MBL fold metallo-hydrolase [Vicinamibacterales bacterium]
MIVRRFFEPLLAQTSYLIGCAETGEALIIDPNRDIKRYVTAAAQERLRITHVTETHIHADFVSGSRELAHRTGATLHLSDEGDNDWKYQYLGDTPREGKPGAKDDANVPRVNGRLIRHGDRITLGNVIVEAVHTPGHTPEHLTFLITDGAAADQPIAAATGDFIFVGDVGRPDLLEKTANVKGTMDSSARTLWHSVRDFARRDDWLQIWPGHGAGSACGKGISAIPHSTLGYERRFNWAFRVATEDEFVEHVLTDQPEPPKYFATMKRVNKEGPALLGRFRTPARLNDHALLDLIERKALIVDTRPASDYAAKFVPGTFNIPLNPTFVTWAGWLVPYTTDLYLIVDEATTARMTEVVRALALIGLDRVAGILGPTAIAHAADHGATLGNVTQVTPSEVADRVAAKGVTVLDVRNSVEFAEGHIPASLHIPLGYLGDRVREVPSDRPVVVQCHTGQRSQIGASLLRKLGRQDVMNLVGGIAAWEEAGLPVEK